MAREVVTGYCWPQSVRAGEEVGLHLSSSGGRPVRVEVARVGGRREVVFRADAIAAEDHETPKDASARGCGWPVAVSLAVDPAWRSGYYEVVMEIDVGEKVRRDYAFFVVRPAARAPIVLALAANTWHAYNDFGGTNLYNGGTQVAMQRPMAAGYLRKPPGKGRRVTGTGAPDPQNAAHVGYVQLNHLSEWAGSAGWPDWELPFLEWAERDGFEIGVCTNADLELHPEVLDGAELYLSVGHDEYWSRGMRDTVEDFIGAGGNAAFFSGNTSLWQVRIEGEDHDVVVGYKGFFKDDPLMGTGREAEVTTFWSDVIVGRPENHMTGVSFTRGGYPHRSQRDGGPRWLHGPPARSLDLRRHGARVRRRPRVRRDGGRLRVRWVRVHLPGRTALSHRRGRDTVELRDPRHLPDAALHPRDGSAPAQVRRAERTGVPRRARVRDS